MNSLTGYGMSLWAASIPATLNERAEMAYLTGLRIVEMVKEDLLQVKIMTRSL